MLAVLAGAVFAMLVVTPTSSLQRLASTATSIVDGDINGRVALWNQGLDVFYEHPLFGIGSGAFARAVEGHDVAHNSFLSVLAESGIIGFALFLITLGIVVYGLVHLPQGDRMFWLVLILVCLIGASALSFEHRKSTWLILSWMIAGQSLRMRQ